MNERIQELAEQCYEHDQSWTGVGQRIFNKEKFADMIVQECISVMKSTVDESIDFERKLDETSSWIESDINKHFGVKE
jgi:hypothetical protein